MQDLISRQAAIDEIEEYADRLQMVNWKENPGVPYKAYALNWCINTIRDLPSAQPEIVRCKDCENWIPGYITDNDDFIPPKCGKYQQMVGHSSSDYCSLAERRTDE